MKHLINILTLITGVFIYSCSDDYNVDKVSDVNLDITLDNAHRYDQTNQAYVIKLNNPAEFTFHGDNVDNILFYSGEPGYEYRYRNRVVADQDSEIKPTILIKTAFSSPNDAKSGKFRFMVAHDLQEYTSDAVAAADWVDVGDTDLHKGIWTTADVTQYYYPTLGLKDNANFADDYSDWKSHVSVVYGIRAKSNEAQYNRLKLRQFEVKNTETRDYGYVLDGTPISVKKSKDYQIFKAMSMFDASFKITNDITAAGWSSYTPSMTTPEGSSDEVPNSKWYVWNVAEMGLKYGEGTGYPWVKLNGAGQDIKCTYDTEVWAPNKNIDMGGVIGNTPTDAMKKEPSESWLISRSHHPRQVARDEVSSYVKIKSMNMVWNFSHAFLSKGMYTVTFVVNNQNRNQTYEMIKEFRIIVIE